MARVGYPSALMSPAGPIVLDADQKLTQCGIQYFHGSFRFPNSLRSDRDPPEVSMSVLLGTFAPSEAQIEAYGPGHGPKPRDAVRRTTAGRLREAGFRVVHTPRVPMSPNHVSVYWDGDWDDDVTAVFDECFDEAEGGRD